MPDLPNLVWLRAFESSARLSSFTAAAEELCLTQAAVSNQVRSLEQKLGVTLFIRRSRTLELTDMGRAWFPAVNKAIEDLALSTQGLFGPRHDKPITLRIPISTAAVWLAPRLAEFRRQHPAVNLRLISAIWADAIADEDVDVDVRIGHGYWPGYQARLLAEETMVPVCAYCLKDEIHSVTQLQQQELIHIHGYQDHWARLFKHYGLPLQQIRHSLSVDTSNMALELAASGNGFAMIMKRLAHQLLPRGRIAIPLDCEIPMGQAYYLVTPVERLVQVKEVVLLMDWLEAMFNKPN